METANIILQVIQTTFLSVDWQNLYFIAKFLFIFLDLLLIIGIILVLPKAMSFCPHFIWPNKKKKKEMALNLVGTAKERWAEILVKSEISLPHSLTLAIIEADSFVDSVLKEIGLRGETMADRMKQINPADIKSLNDVWQAHKTRNELVHTPGAEIEIQSARQFLNYYEKFLKEIGVL